MIFKKYLNVLASKKIKCIVWHLQYKFLNSPPTGKALEINSSDHYVIDSEHLHTLQKPSYNIYFIP